MESMNHCFLEITKEEYTTEREYAEN